MPDEITSSTKAKETAKWSSADEATLVATLVQQKALAIWADNNPKPAAYAACVEALRGSEDISGGIPKSKGVVKTHWNKVSLSPLVYILY